jgi:hypothetical protein
MQLVVAVFLLHYKVHIRQLELWFSDSAFNHLSICVFSDTFIETTEGMSRIPYREVICSYVHIQVMHTLCS